MGGNKKRKKNSSWKLNQALQYTEGRTERLEEEKSVSYKHVQQIKEEIGSMKLKTITKNIQEPDTSFCIRNICKSTNNQP